MTLHDAVGEDCRPASVLLLATQPTPPVNELLRIDGGQVVESPQSKSMEGYAPDLAARMCAVCNFTGHPMDVAPCLKHSSCV